MQRKTVHSTRISLRLIACGAALLMLATLLSCQDAPATPAPSTAAATASRPTATPIPRVGAT